MSDVGFDETACWVNDFLSMKVISMVYFIQCGAIVFFETSQALLARKGLAVRFHLLFPFYRKFVYVFMLVTVFRAVTYGILHFAYHDPPLETLLDNSPRLTPSEWVRWMFYTTATSSLTTFYLAATYLLSGRSCGSDAIANTARVSVWSFFLQLFSWCMGAFVPKVKFWFVCVSRLVLVAFFYFLALRSLVFPARYPRVAARVSGLWFGSLVLLESLIYVDFVSDSHEITHDCAEKSLMVIFAGIAPLVLYVVLHVDSAYWRHLASTKGFDDTSVSTMVVPLVQQFFPSHVVMDINSFDVGDELGSGGFATVFCATYRGQQVFALKKNFISVLTDDVVSNFLSEALLLYSIPPHPNVVPLRGVCIAPPFLCLVVEICHCSLFDFLKHAREHQYTIPLLLRLQLAVDIADGIHHLHSLPIPVIHRDLKSHNVLLTIPTPTAPTPPETTTTTMEAQTATETSSTAKTTPPPESPTLAPPTTNNTNNTNATHTNTNTNTSTPDLRSTYSPASRASVNLFSPRFSRRGWNTTAQTASQTAQISRPVAKISDFGCSRLFVQNSPEESESRKSNERRSLGRNGRFSAGTGNSMRGLFFGDEQMQDAPSPLRPAQPLINKRTITWYQRKTQRNRQTLLAFGSSTAASVDLTGQIGTIPWSAPEVLRNESYDTSCDIFSMGVLLWEIFTGDEPRNGRQFRILDCISGFRLPFPSQPPLPAPIKNLIRRCWDEIPANRPTIETVRAELTEMLILQQEKIANHMV